jgi:ketosteroid isomerase-like protein
MHKPAALVVTLWLLATPVPGQEPSAGSPLASLVDTERAFSRMSVAQGTRVAFLAYFADDGVSFAPEPVKTRESLLKQPAPATPPAVVLEWMPVTGDVARAGDLGYTTGPWVRSERKPGGKPLAYGWYFTVWKRQVDGTWKVAADIGTTTPAHGLPGTDAFRPAGGAGAQGSSAPARAGQVAASALLAAEKTFSDRAASGVLEAYLAVGTENVRLHRDGAEPAVGVAAVKSSLAGGTLPIAFTPIKADVSQSRDLGYAYGSYAAQGGPSGAPKEERGYYLRIWKHLAGDWRLVADITNPMPVATPPR